MRKIVVQAAVVIILIIVFSSSLRAQQGPIRILILHPLSGPAKASGEQWVLGARFAVDETNAQGGVLGRKVELISEDSQLKPEVAMSKAQKYLLEGRADIILGAGSNIVKPLQDLTKEYNILLVMAAHSDDETGKNFTYNAVRPTWNTSMMARTLVAYAAKNLPYKKFYLLNQDYSYGRDYGAALKREIARQIPGGQIVADDYHPLMSKDLSPFFTKIKNSGAEAIISSDWGLDISVLLKQRLDLGIKAVVLGPALADRAVILENPDASLNNIAVDTYFPTVNTKESIAFVSDWKKWYKGAEYPEPTSIAAREYIGIKFILEGVKKAGSVEVNKLVPALEGLRMKSVIGEIYMRVCDHQLIMPLPVVTITSKTPPYFSPATMIPASEVAIEEEEVNNPRCKRK
ncbi:MAG: ABC transporter substrate-binding protein [Thermodesulfobacteriota bacterium]|jgi:ABC-type branched-subunit amino acid transport system substrate-binding protein